jgi:hypothetical protein
MASPVVRGVVTGIGLITALAGLRDLTVTILSRPSAATRIAGAEHGPTER